VEEVAFRWKHDPRPHCRQRWLIIYQALVDPREAAQIAKHCGVSTETVHQLISAYKRHGVAAVETPGKGGRRYGYLTLEQEQQFLAPFFAQAQVGTITTVAQIKQAFEAQVGQEVAETTRLTFAPPSWLAQARPTLLPSESQPRGPSPV
jgi:transposase